MSDLSFDLKKEGVEITVSCGTCGRDVHVMNPWGELHALTMQAPVAGVMPTLTGACYKLGCPRCKGDLVYEIGWDEIARWIPRAQQAGFLPKLQQATARR